MRFDWSRLRPRPKILQTIAASSAAVDVQDTIERALQSAGLLSSARAPSGRSEGDTARTVHRSARARSLADGSVSDLPAPVQGVKPHPGDLPQLEVPGSFTTHALSVAAGTRSYKLYVPSGYEPSSGRRVALLMMLHGCTQSPDDFAAGTRMNALAERHGFLVVYPAQAPGANGSRCWNWFQADHQNRERGEPAILAAIAGEVAEHYRVDRESMFVAGLSAGAAMAVILGNQYPELFSAIGIHSGLPYAAAHDVSSAFQAMHGHGSGVPRAHAARYELPAARAGAGVRTIVFHGDSDHTVDLSNSAAIVANAVGEAAADSSLVKASMRGVGEHGRAFERSVFTDADGRIRVEYWIVEGAGHAWMGGSPAGSYTDPKGPDASAEMVRFFLNPS